MIKAVQMNKELFLSVENKIGQLAKISKILSERGINIEALAGYIKAGTTEAQIRLTADNDSLAVDALKKNGFTNIKEKSVLVVSLENKPGALNVVTSKLAKENIGIISMYGTSCEGDCCALCRVIVDTSDNQKATVLLTP
ncbi:MAG: ACT domain-containing protein [Candidatus Omnitrophica bacterium]|nr:ACT domain-containing protein [Candidatus Omnitrophota bacterium]